MLVYLLTRFKTVTKDVVSKTKSSESKNENSYC